jgi:NADP-dependent 3-hydroxy acid dehydrogenase YdfG
MGKLEGKVAVVTGGSSGMALASAKRFVEEGAYVFITGRRQKALDEAVKLIGRNVTGVRGDAASLDDLDRRCSTRSSGKRARSTSCTRAPAWAKPSHWAKLPSSISMRPST